MSDQARSAARLALVLLLMCAVVCAQAASLASEHSHQHSSQPHSSQHCCGLCHAGPLPFLQPIVPVALAPMVALAWLPSAADLDSPRELLLSAGFSRAPPASLTAFNT